MENANKKLAINLFLMFLVYFMPKIFSFFLVPLYTTYLTTEQYGISDLILSTASLIGPFVSLATPSAILRFTIEKKEDARAFQFSKKVYLRGMALLLISLTGVYFITSIKLSYLIFTYIIVGTAILSDIHISYLRGLEKMKAVTICGVGSSLISIICNILFIVVFKLGLYGFLLASATGYIFIIFVCLFTNRENKELLSITKIDKSYEQEILKFSVPLIFSGLSWWVISSSDRYFVSWMCGTAVNGIYSVAYKIPTILQALDNVFGQAWLFTAYDSYKTVEGKKYIARVFEVYNFVFCLGCSVLIVLDKYVSGILFSNDFYAAWKYVPFLLISVVFSSASSLVAVFLSINKKTKISMNISLIAASTNMVLNWILIYMLKDAMGAAIATAVTFFVSWLLTTIVATKVSGIKFNLSKQIVVYAILLFQGISIIIGNNVVALIGAIAIILINWKTIVWAKDKWRVLLKRNTN